MAEYIELDVAKKAFQNMDAGRVGCSTLLTPEEFSEYLDEIPTADVAPVRRGHWVRVETGTTCSECMQGLLRINGKQSEWVDLSGMPYCPNCGVKMEVQNG